MPRKLAVSEQEDASRPRRKRRSWTPVPDPNEETPEDERDNEDPILLPPVDPPQRRSRP